MKNVLKDNPRSTLHALQPEGAGTARIESLVSYFCRLAVSHSTSVTALSRMVTQTMSSEIQSHFDWRDRNLSGIGASAIEWSGALSALTSVDRLDRLTLSHWRHVLAPRGLMAPSTGKWCPLCLHADREINHIPYFRLAWDLKLVTACERHRVQLECTCPTCGKSGVRHRSAYVVPGWCTRCQNFLGVTSEHGEASREAIWIAEQVGRLLNAQALPGTAPTLKNLQQAITALVIRLDDGNGASFGARVGVSKSTVHCWTHGKTALTLDAALQISASTGLALDKLLQADLSSWASPTLTPQLNLNLELASRQRAAPPRIIDWVSVRAQLRKFAKESTPISLAEASRRLGIEASYLYLHTNKEARYISAGWRAYSKYRSTMNRVEARGAVKRACLRLLAEGRALTMRELREILTPSELAASKHLINMITEIKKELGVG